MYSRNTVEIMGMVAINEMVVHCRENRSCQVSHQCILPSQTEYKRVHVSGKIRKEKGDL